MRSALLPADSSPTFFGAHGEVELEGRVLVIRRIRARMELRADPEHPATAERVHGLYAESCPIPRTLKPANGITIGADAAAAVRPRARRRGPGRAATSAPS